MNEFHNEYGPSSTGPVGVAVDGLFGLTTDPPACDVRAELQDFREAFSIRLFPVGFDLLGDHVVLREESLEGSVFWRDHELWDDDRVPKLFPIAADLESFYNSLTVNPFSD